MILERSLINIKIKKNIEHLKNNHYKKNSGNGLSPLL